MSVYFGCSLFQNGFQITDSLTYTPPAIEIVTAPFKAGAMNAPVYVDRGTKPMAATFKIGGSETFPYVFLGFTPGVEARLTVRRVYRDSGEVRYLEDELTGFISAIRPDPHGASNKGDVGHTITMSVNYLKISANGLIPLLEINPIQGLRKIMGVNVLGIPNNLLNLIL